jgi:hypothetical protein
MDVGGGEKRERGREREREKGRRENGEGWHALREWKSGGGLRFLFLCCH